MAESENKTANEQEGTDLRKRIWKWVSNWHTTTIHSTVCKPIISANAQVCIQDFFCKGGPVS